MRTAHFIDIENVCRDGHARNAQDAADNYRQIVRPGPTDQIVVGAGSVETAFAAAEAFPGARLVLQYGHDGADQALIQFAADELEVLTTQFDVAVIASGDHAFAELSATLKSAGITVAVAAIPGSLSRELASEADAIIDLPGTWVPAA